MGASSFSQVHHAMGQAVKDGVFPGAVLVWGNGGDIWFHRAYGTANLTTGELVVENTIFDLASLTKPLATTLAIAQLIKQKRLTLTTSLADILPGSGDTNKAGINVNMLLRHTSGLPAHREYFKMIKADNPEPRACLRRLVLSEPLAHPPGTRELYSDLGFILLAWIVELASGQRFDHAVRTLVFDPIGIDNLFFPGVNQGRTGRTGTAATSRCPWRGRLMQGEVEDENAWVAGGIEGHAGLFGDGASVFRLCSAILAAAQKKTVEVPDPGILGAFIKKERGRERVAGFDTPAKQHSSAGRCFSKQAFGHLGFTGTSVWLDPVTGLIVVLLTNRVHPSRENLKIRAFRPFIHNLIHDRMNGLP